jgi:hypothetical protein
MQQNDATFTLLQTSWVHEIRVHIGLTSLQALAGPSCSLHETVCRELQAPAARQRQPRQRRCAVLARAAADSRSAADQLRASQDGLKERFDAIEAKALETAFSPSDDGMTSGDDDVPEIEEVFVDNYDAKIKMAPDDVVIVDFYTKCAPAQACHRLCNASPAIYDMQLLRTQAHFC